MDHQGPRAGLGKVFPEAPVHDCFLPLWGLINLPHTLHTLLGEAILPTIVFTLSPILFTMDLSVFPPSLNFYF